VIEHTPLWAFTGQELAFACSISGTETMPDDPTACAIIRALLDASADPTTGKWPFTPTRRKRTKRGRRRSDYSTDSSSDDEHHDNDHQDNINNDDDDDDEVERELAQELIAKSAAMSPIAADHYMNRPFALSKRTKAAITTVALSCLEPQQTSDAFYLPRELLLMLAAYGLNLSQVSQSQLEVFLMRGISNSRAADTLKLMRCLLDHRESVDPTNTGLTLLRIILNTANLTDVCDRQPLSSRSYRNTVVDRRSCDHLSLVSPSRVRLLAPGNTALDTVHCPTLGPNGLYVRAVSSRTTGYIGGLHLHQSRATAIRRACTTTRSRKQCQVARCMLYE